MTNPAAALPELPKHAFAYLFNQSDMRFFWTDDQMREYGRLCLARASESAQAWVHTSQVECRAQHEETGREWTGPLDGVPPRFFPHHVRLSTPAQAVAPSDGAIYAAVSRAANPEAYDAALKMIDAAVADEAAVTLPPLNAHDHPESQVMVWSSLEIPAIQRYATAAVLADRARRAPVESAPHRCTLETVDREQLIGTVEAARSLGRMEGREEAAVESAPQPVGEVEYIGAADLICLKVYGEFPPADGTKLYATPISAADTPREAWISVAERLPESDTRVIGFWPSGLAISGGVGTASFTGEWFWDDGDAASKPTHWMPLPKAPSAMQSSAAQGKGE